MKAEVQALDVALLLTTVFERLGFSARAAGVRLSADMPPRGLRLLGDRSHLLQVLLNLATTAIEAVGRGGLVTLAARPGDDREVILEIADNGPGIPPDVGRRETLCRLSFPTAPDEPDRNRGDGRCDRYGT